MKTIINIEYINGLKKTKLKRFAKISNKIVKTIIMKTRTLANIQKVGGSYRVRVQKNGKRVSKSFTSQKAALTFRKKVQA